MFHALLTITLVVLIGSIGQARGEYNKLEFNDCGSNMISINKIDITPMPILRPSLGNLSLNVQIKRPIVLTNIRLSVQAIRNVQSIILPVSCYKVGDTKVGSCEYSGAELCRFMNSWWPQFFSSQTCSSIFSTLGIDCSCPFKTLNAQTVNIVNKKIDIPDFGSPILTYFSTGDFSIKLVAYEEGSPATSQPLFCGTFKYTVYKGRSTGK